MSIVLLTALGVGGATLIGALIGFNFKKSGDNWFITGLSQNNNSTELDFASFTYNGSLVNSYIIYKNAFSNKDITSVNIGPTVSEIMGHAFSDCSNLSTLTFEEDCTLTDISNYAFADCTKLRSVILPNSLRNLGEGTFRNCGQLESVLLPANLDNIGAAAFYNCTHLYDVMNLTSHNISVGSGSYGYAGYYALAVRVSNTPLELTTVTTTSTTANFVQYNDIWYLVRLDTLSDSGVIEIPRLIVNEQECRYTIFAYALSSLSNYYNRNVLIYNCVDAIGDNAASRLSYHTLYFYGSDKELETLNTSYTLNFYTYLECFHEENMGAWRYDDEGEISTTPTIEVSIISEPTCKETGSQKVSCSICGEEKIETLPTTNDHDFVDDTCTICNKTKQVCTISAENFDSCGLFSHSGSTRFTINDEGVITSQNHSDRSSSQLIITATDEMTITFDYMVSSESGYDHLKIYVNGTQHTAISGTSNNYQSLSIELNAGDTLTFEYSKDGSSSRGDDCAYIKNLTITTIVLVEETA